MLPKWLDRKPVARTMTYIKFGFVITEHHCYGYPRCGEILNAGPNYQPRYYDRCGQKINHSGAEWKEERQLGYAERSNEHESVKN